MRETTSNARTTEQILFKCSRFRRIRSTQCSSSCLQSLPTTWGLGLSAPCFRDQVHVVRAVRRLTSAIHRELCSTNCNHRRLIQIIGSRERAAVSIICHHQLQTCSTAPFRRSHRLQGSTKTRGLMRYWKLTNLLVWSFSKEHAVKNLCNPCN